MNRHTDDLRAARWERSKRAQLAKARCLWCLIIAPLIIGMIYFAGRFAQVLAWWIAGDERAGWSSIMWAAPFLVLVALLFWAAIGWPDEDNTDTES